METHFSRKIQLGIAAVILLMSSISTSYAETPTDRVTSKIPDAGPGGFTRITFFDGLNGANYSVQPNAQHANFNSVLKVCSESNDSECIESLSYRKKGDVSWVSGKLLSTKNPSMNSVYFEPELTFTTHLVPNEYWDMKTDIYRVIKEETNLTPVLRAGWKIHWTHSEKINKVSQSS